ncbi:MAG TPA: InlB B-repeat-containing protein, partial [Methanocorpusculum sp.]|nr:InlB B-repeat-containing protein [Methanocorpusculum sp.]
MMQRMKGTLRPGRKAGVLALAVLLLTCVLMAGAVSAEEKVTEFNQSNFKNDNTYPIFNGGTYVLNENAKGNITIKIDADAGDNVVILKAINGATLTGGIQITAEKSATVTVKDMHIKSTFISGSGSDARNLAITLSGASIQLCLENNTIEFAASGVEKGSSVISTGNPLLDGSKIIDNTISGVTAHVLNTRGVADDGTLTVQGNTVTMSPDEPIGSNEEKQGTGRALLKLFHGSGPNSKVTYIVADNVVKISDGSHDATVVRVDKNTDTPGNIAVTMYNNTYNGSSASPYLYGGSIYGYELGGLNITVSKTDETRILVPGLNQTGVEWGGDATSGYTLSITAPGSYKLMDDVTISSMKVDAAATINGNKKTLTLSETNGYQGVITVDNGATLQNLNVVAANGATFGTAIKVKDGSLTDSTIDLRNQNAKSPSTEGRMSAIAVFVEDGTISRNTILAGNSDTSSSQCVVVNGDGVTVSGNTLTTGESAKGTSGSVGIRLSSGASGTTIIDGNTITSMQGAGLNNGIAADGVKTNVIIAASGNTFALAATEYGGGAFYVNPKSSVNTVTLNANGNTVESAASFIYADNAEGAATYAISGAIENNDFAAADEGLVSADADRLTLTLENFKQSGNSGLITDPSESLTVDTVASEITVTGATVDENGENAIIAFTGYTILITNATVDGSDTIYYKGDSAAIVTHDTVRHMGSLTDIDVKLLITDMPKLEEISTPKATIGDAEKAQLAAEKITPLSVVDIHHKGEPGFDRITLTISGSGLAPSDKIIGFHVGASGVDTSEVTTQDGKHIVKFTDLTSASPFGIGVISDEPQPTPLPPSYSSGDGNMENAYRVLFNDGSTTLSVVTDLSSGDKLTKPATPVKDGYTFAGWYKDSACTQAWDFETGIPGDMTLYAKWTA